MATNHGFGSILALALVLALFLAIAPPAVLSARPDAKSSGAGYFGPGGGFGIPGFGFPPGFGGIVGGGYGGGYSGPGGGYSRSGVFRPTVVCNVKGPCYKRRLTCPAKCFKSYSSSGKNYGGGGGGGGCTMDCTKKCIAYC